MQESQPEVGPQEEGKRWGRGRRNNSFFLKIGVLSYKRSKDIQEWGWEEGEGQDQTRSIPRSEKPQNAILLLRMSTHGGDSNVCDGVLRLLHTSKQPSMVGRHGMVGPRLGCLIRLSWMLPEPPGYIQDLLP